MVSTSEVFTDNSPISNRTSEPVKKPTTQKSLFMFTNILDVKKTACRQVGAAESKCKAIKFGNTLWELKQTQKGNSKINE